MVYLRTQVDLSFYLFSAQNYFTSRWNKTKQWCRSSVYVFVFSIFFQYFFHLVFGLAIYKLNVDNGNMYIHQPRHQRCCDWPDSLGKVEQQYYSQEKNIKAIENIARKRVLFYNINIWVHIRYIIYSDVVMVWFDMVY